MTAQINNSIMAFDPGGTTGFAAIANDGRVLYTTNLLLDQLERFVEFCDMMDQDAEIVVEGGPEWKHHSPVTRRAEAVILDMFPSAHRVLPNQWKGHPASRKLSELIGRTIMMTKHEHDAARLGIWFKETGGISSDKERKNTARTDS